MGNAVTIGAMRQRSACSPIYCDPETAWTFISSTAPTSCSATTTPCRRRAMRTAARSAPCAACSPRCSAMINGGATHVGVATDHVIESFRNRLWPGYKTGDGIEPDLLAQFPLLEEALDRARRRRLADGRVRGRRCAGGGRRDRGARSARRARDHLHARQGSGAVRARHAGRAAGSAGRARSATKPASIAKFGVPPASIPDYLALVGDAADGYPGLPGWGAKSAAAVLAKYRPSRGDSRRLARRGA